MVEDYATSGKIAGQCFGGTETYEKTTGVKFSFGTTQGILTQPGTGITRDCTAICRQTPTCAAFTVDYENSRCQSYNMDSTGHRNSLHDKIGSNYFEKICLRGVSNLNAMCGDRLWAFERAVGAFLEGFDDREERNVQTKTECEKLCLFETSFTCRSAEFDESINICRLSREDRRSQPAAFRRQPGSTVDYLENQCVRSLPDCRYNVREGTAVISMDELQFAASQGECEALCDQARGFTCRAFTYAMEEKRCYLSGDDSISLSSAPLIAKRDAVYAEKQCSISQCEDGLFTFEKVTGHFLRSAQQVGLAMAASPGVTLECGARCLEAGSDCPAFTLDYNSMKCFKLDRNTQGRGSELSAREGQSYFEKICLRGNVRGCEGRAWAFDRRPGKELRGFDDLKLPLVQSRRDCMEECLAQRRFDCRSAEYDTQTAECRLSSEDRRSRPSDFVDAPSTVEYLENQCLPSESRCNFKSVPNSYPRYLDIVLSLVSDEVDCERRCYEYSDFICRSFSYYPSGSQCFISGDDRGSAGNEALMSRPGTNYYERSCLVAGGPGPGTSPSNPQGRCAVGRAEFEKVTGYELQGQREYPLLRGHNPGLAVQCANQCKIDPRCHGFNFNYKLNECTALEGDADPTRIDIRQVPGVAYFEGVCLRGAGCGMAWTFERHVNRELRGFTNAHYITGSKTECEDRCLDERSFICRSASYSYRRQECRLSSEDRFTQPQAFEMSMDSDYLENQCIPPVGRCAYRNFQRDRQLIYTDKSLSAFSDSSCQHACDVEREFMCRSYTFLSTVGSNTNQCLLSASVAAGTEQAFKLQNGALYAEKQCGSLQPPEPVPPPGRPGSDPGSRYPSGTDQDGVLSPYPCRYTLTYEKIAGAAYGNAQREPIRTRADIGISGECLIKCGQLRHRCLAVSLENVRGGRQRCYSIERSADSDGGLLTSAPELAYFQKICLQGRICPKAWAFTRVPSYELNAPNAIEIKNMFGRRQCQDQCLQESRIVCRSATYYGRDRVCKLSPDTRRSLPQHFRRAAGDVDYMENECAQQPPNCEYTNFPGKFLPYTDRYVPQTYATADCRRLCNQEREFPCRSFNYNSARRDCFLSSDDTFAADKTALLSDKDFFYSEHGSCSNVRVDCTQADMLVTFLFGAPFEGRVYSTGNPQACFEMGNGQAQIVLRIPMGTQCGTVQQGRGRYVNHVVIQQNPVIMQETDKTVRVECTFDASDQTVSYAPSGTRDQEGGGISVSVPFRPSGTNIVTNTAPTPNVRMRIVTRTGQEASVVGLGEELRLKIEIDPSSAFGIFVRNLEARTDNGELLTLVDNVGCPHDHNIFPALQVERGVRDLFADFKAFRFPSTSTVNFVATVQFCQDICEPIRCNNGVHSFGRRRRSTNSTLDTDEESEPEIDRNVTTSESSSTQGPLDQPSSSKSYEAENTTMNIANVSQSEEVENEEAPVTASAHQNPATDKSENITNASVPVTEAKNLQKSDVELPSELPVQLKLVVGPNSLPELPKSLRNSSSKSHLMTTVNNIVTGVRDASYPTGMTEREIYTEEEYICTPRPLVVVSVLTLLLINVSMVIGFVIFYRVRKKTWRTGDSSLHKITPVAVPEVLFRSVYGQLPPNPSFANLGHQLST
ncbi:uncharacterized protein LOC111863521 isoform X3 [Cryptotermes secundus]|uniref:uncharacterized protein LOC111863521 isoform X3 n=1 Tax=Cryptotermes secundus TaxID=105785 RepID=UPI001454D18E|nr:uncharacterized protein LOC111863521 isoform X3 [Cryptotermes secundus]